MDATYLTNTVRNETSTRRAIKLVEAHIRDRDTLEDLLLQALPFVEEAENDPAYKKGYVKEICAKIRAQIEESK